jgi:hypothetical protein
MFPAYQKMSRISCQVCLYYSNQLLYYNNYIVSAKAVYEQTRSKFDKQKNDTNEARRALDNLQKNSLFFQVDDSRVASREANGSRSALQSGLTATDYNTVLQRLPEPPFARCALPAKPDHDAVLHKELYAYRRHKGPDWLPKDFFMRDVQPDPNLAVELPRNIQHRYGTQVCRNVLNDSERVNSYFERRRARCADKEPSDAKLPIEKAKMTDPNKGDYEELGHSLRHDFFPGVTSNHHVGITKTVYNDDVHKKRVKNPDEWRFQRDELSKLFTNF